MFPFPAHQTGRAQLEHPAFRLVSPQRPRKLSDNTAPCDGTPVTLPSRCGNSWMGNIRNHSGFQTFVNDRSVALSPAHQKQGPFPPPTLLGLHGYMTLSDFRAGHHPIDDVEGATFTTPGYPAITQITFLACCAHYPGGSNRCACRFLPCACFSYHVSPTTTWVNPPSTADLRRWGAPLTRHLRLSVKRDLLKVSRSPQLFSTVGPQPLAVAKPVSDNAAGGRASIWFHRKAYGLASSGIEYEST